MQIQDLSNAVQDLAAVRGGANYASNYSANGPVLSGVFARTGNTNNSAFDIQNTVVQQNSTTQDAVIHDISTHTRTTEVLGSQINLSRLWGMFD